MLNHTQLNCHKVQLCLNNLDCGHLFGKMSDRRKDWEQNMSPEDCAINLLDKNVQ